MIKLSRLLRRRLRLTDTAGYLANGRVAALLPETPETGAWKVASDICDAYPVGHERPNCEVYVYPDEMPPSGRLDAPAPASNRSRSLSAELDSLFVHPTPMLKRAVDVLGASVRIDRGAAAAAGDRRDHQADFAWAGVLYAAA